MPIGAAGALGHPEHSIRTLDDLIGLSRPLPSTLATNAPPEPPVAVSVSVSVSVSAGEGALPGQKFRPICNPAGVLIRNNRAVREPKW